MHTDLNTHKRTIKITYSTPECLTIPYPKIYLPQKCMPCTKKLVIHVTETQAEEGSPNEMLESTLKMLSLP